MLQSVNIVTKPHYIGAIIQYLQLSVQNKQRKFISVRSALYICNRVCFGLAYEQLLSTALSSTDTRFRIFPCTTFFICIVFQLLQPISTSNIYFSCIVVLLLQPISTSAISFLASHLYLYRSCRCNLSLSSLLYVCRSPCCFDQVVSAREVVFILGAQLHLYIILGTATFLNHHYLKFVLSPCYLHQAVSTQNVLFTLNCCLCNLSQSLPSSFFLSPCSKQRSEQSPRGIIYIGYHDATSAIYTNLLVRYKYVQQTYSCFDAASSRHSIHLERCINIIMFINFMYLFYTLELQS